MAMAMTPQELAATPAGRPPPGILPNHVNPHNTGPKLIVVGSVLVALMLVFVAVRIYTKIRIVGKFSPDDYTCIIAAFGAILYFIIDVLAVTVGNYGTHLWDLTLADVYSDSMLIIAFFCNWPFFFFIAFAKITFFLLYLQLFHPMKWLRYCCYAGLAVTGIFYLSVTVFSLALTAPAPGQSWQEALQRPGQGALLKATVGIACGGLVLDVYILVLPIVGVQQLQLSRKRKIGVIAVFMTGLLACIASSLAIYFKWILRYQKGGTDETYQMMPPLLTGLVEICVGVIASCMPSMSNLLRHLPTWENITSIFTSRFYSQRYDASWYKIFDQSNRKPKKALYADLELESGVGNGSGVRGYEMAPVKTVRTFVRTGKPGVVGEDGIHLQHDVEQQISMSKHSAFQ